MSLWAVLLVMVLFTCLLKVQGSLAYTRASLPCLSNLAVLFNTFKVLLLMDGGARLQKTSVTERLLSSSHVRERDKVGGVWNGFLLEKVRREGEGGILCLVDFVVKLIMIFSGIAFLPPSPSSPPFPPLVQLRDNPKSTELMQMDKRH